MSFTIHRILTKTLEKDAKEIKVEFFYNGPRKKVIIRLYETFFDLGWRMIGGVVEVTNGPLYWVSDRVTNGLTFRMTKNIKVEFIDSESNEIIESHICTVGNDNYILRSQRKGITNKNIWVIGDSNVWNYFSNYDYGSEDFNINGNMVVPIDIPALSINRFVNRDGVNFLNTLPLYKGDDVIFILGEIDCRVGFYRNSILKGNNIIKQISNVVDRYIDKLHLLIEEFSEVTFKVSLPNPAFRDGLIDKVDEFLSDSDENDRLYIRRYFSDYLTTKCLEHNIECLNLTDGLQDEKGFMRVELLEKNDTHNKPTDIIMQNLRKYYDTIT
jgi:hypothetical protein